MPMQIDTWNRDKMNLTGSPFVPGPLPKHSLSPSEGALYSGLLECPLTDRVVKTIEGGAGFNTTYNAAIFQCSKNQTGCEHSVGTAEECFNATRDLPGLNNATIKTAQGSSPDLPSGCTISQDPTSGIMTAFFNTYNSQKCCGSNVTSLTGTYWQLQTRLT